MTVYFKEDKDLENDEQFWISLKQRNSAELVKFILNECQKQTIQTARLVCDKEPKVTVIQQTVENTDRCSLRLDGKYINDRAQDFCRFLLVCSYVSHKLK